MKNLKKHVLISTTLMIGALAACGPEGPLAPGLGKTASTLNSAFDKQAKGDNNGAKAEYLKILNDQPRDIPTRLNLANLYLQIGESAEATKLFKQILQDEPENVIAATGLAISLNKEGKSEESNQTISKSTNGLQTSLSPLNRPKKNTSEIKKPEFLGKIRDNSFIQNFPSNYPHVPGGGIGGGHIIKRYFSQKLDITDSNLHVFNKMKIEDTETTDIHVTNYNSNLEYEYIIPIENVLDIEKSDPTNTGGKKLEFQSVPSIENNKNFQIFSADDFTFKDIKSMYDNVYVFTFTPNGKDAMGTLSSFPEQDEIWNEYLFGKINLSTEGRRSEYPLGDLGFTEDDKPESKDQIKKNNLIKNNYSKNAEKLSMQVIKDKYEINYKHDYYGSSDSMSPERTEVSSCMAEKGIGNCSSIVTFNYAGPSQARQPVPVKSHGSIASPLAQLSFNGKSLTKLNEGFNIILSDKEATELKDYIGSALPKKNRLRKKSNSQLTSGSGTGGSGTCQAEDGTLPDGFNPENRKYLGPNSSQVYSLLDNLSRLNISYKLPNDPYLCGDGGTPPDFFSRGLLKGNETVKETGKIPVLLNCQRDFFVAAATLHAYTAAGYARKIGTRSDGKTAEQLAEDSATLMMKNLAQAEKLRDTTGQVPNGLYALGITKDCWSAALYP